MIIIGLSSEARRRAGAPLVGALSSRAEAVVGAIPITSDGWNRFASRFACLVRTSLPELVESVAAAARSDDFGAIRESAARAADFIGAADELLLPACMFAGPAGDPGARGAHELVGHVGDRWLRKLLAGDDLPTNGRNLEGDLLDAAVGLCVEKATTASDLWQTAFSVDEWSMLDGEGAFSLPNLLAAYRSRPEQLLERVASFYAPLGTVAMEPMKAMRYAAGLLRAEDPVEHVRVALHVRKLIRTAYAERCSATVDSLSDLLAGVRKSHANWQRIRTLSNGVVRLGGDGSDVGHYVSETEQLDRLRYYCKVAEGQIRPWAWTLHRLLTGSSGRQPMLGELRERLASTRDWLALAFEGSIDVHARNAEAHEDFHWDARQQVLVDGDGVGIFVEVLDSMARRGLMLVGGAEFGWALACADLPDLLAAIQPKGRSDLPSVLEVRDALNRLGTNGLLVDGWRQVHDELVVAVRDLIGNPNQTAQALVELCLWLPQIEQFTFRLANEGGRLLTARRETLLAIVPAWVEAQQTFAQMPTVLFLPVFYETRLALQDEDSASNALVSLALNEFAHFTDAFREQCSTGRPVVQALVEYSFALRLVACALEISAGIQEGSDERILGRAYRAVKGARTYADEAAGASDHGERAVSLRALSRMIEKLYDLFEAAPQHPPLPLDRPGGGTVPLTVADHRAQR